MTVIPSISRKGLTSLIFAAHLILMTFLFMKFGFNEGNEGDKYLSAAASLAQGQLKDALEYQWPYASYILYLTPFHLMQIPSRFIIIFTWLILSFFTYRYYIFLESKHPKAASIWLVPMLLSPMILYWHTTLFSETFFMAFLLGSLMYGMNEKKRMLSAGYLICSLLLFFSRPGGALAAISICFYGLYLRGKLSRKTFLFLFSSVTVALFTVILFIPMHFEGVIREIAGGSVHCGFPMYSTEYLRERPNSLFAAYQSFTDEFGIGTLIRLLFLKAVSFFDLNRPYFSAGHNLINALHYLFYIPLLIYPFIRKKKNEPLLDVAFTVILLNLILVMLFYNEWSERYTVQVFPLVLLFSAFILNRNTSNKSEAAF